MAKIYISDKFIKSGGTSGQFLMADGSTSTGTTGGGSGTTITGTPDFLTKINPTGNGIVDSSVKDSSGNFIFSSGSNRTIAIDISDSGIGKNLSLKAGDTTASGTSTTIGTFNALSEFQNWNGIAVASDNSVYVCAIGDIYKQTGGVGVFDPLGQEALPWWAITVAPNGDVYASTAGGDIYVQTGGVGNFVIIDGTDRFWYGLCAAPNGDIYASEYGGGGPNGDIYVRVGGVGDFVALGGTLRNWAGLGAAPNGDIYGGIEGGGDVYVRKGGFGEFIALGEPSQFFSDFVSTPDGTVFATVYGGDIWRRPNGVGPFEPLLDTTRNWLGIAVAPNGNFYATNQGVDIYLTTSSLISSPNNSGGDLNLNSGIGQGGLGSKIKFNTADPVISGPQSLTTKMELDNNGTLTVFGDLNIGGNLNGGNISIPSPTSEVPIHARYDATNIDIGNNVQGASPNSGPNNTFIGDNSSVNETGQGNIAIGAGSNPSNTNSQFCTMIGFGANTQTDGDTEENVFGANAIGHGNYSTTIGSLSTNDTYIQGELHLQKDGGSNNALSVGLEAGFASGGIGISKKWFKTFENFVNVNTVNIPIVSGVFGSSYSLIITVRVINRDTTATYSQIGYAVFTVDMLNGSVNSTTSYQNFGIITGISWISNIVFITIGSTAPIVDLELDSIHDTIYGIDYNNITVS